MEAACVRQWSPHWLLPQGESTDTCLAWCSLSSQGQLKSSRRSRSTSINDWCQSGLTRPCHRPVSKNQSWSRILSPSSLTLAHPSALSHPLLFFSPCDYQSTSLCQDHCRQPVLSCLSHTYTHARGQTFSSPRTRSHVSFPFYFLSYLSFLTPASSSPSVCDPHTLSIRPLNYPPCWPLPYCFWQLGVNVELLLEVITVHDVWAPHSRGESVSQAWVWFILTTRELIRRKISFF